MQTCNIALECLKLAIESSVTEGPQFDRVHLAQIYFDFIIKNQDKLRADKGVKPAAKSM